MEAASDTERVTLNVTINGTDQNPWHRYNLKRNPFPQLGKMEYANIEERISALDGDPIPNEEELRKRLEGATPEFIEVCCQMYQPGKRVRFQISLPKLVS